MDLNMPELDGREATLRILKKDPSANVVIITGRRPNDEMVQGTLRVNLEGAVVCTREVLSGMVDRGEGWVVNVSSTAGTGGSPSDAAYGASKAGLLGFTKSLAKQYWGLHLSLLISSSSSSFSRGTTTRMSQVAMNDHCYLSSSRE
jgi:NAD(P)-dependent dehydrogenase (short-subunit alcohol dehydrogenase family)